jgi:hypothetical protein
MIAITAITSKIWIIPPVKKPPRKDIAQIIMQITATVHKMFAMLNSF